MPVPGSGTDDRADLPAEHGFRFFPGFYRHLPDTMRRIPSPGRRHGGRPPGRRRAGADLAGRRPRRAARARAPARDARRPRAGQPLPALVRDAGRHPGARVRGLRRAAADAAHELRRAPLRAVGAPELVGLRRRRASQRGVRQVPRGRPHPHARGRPGARDERAHRRADPAAAAVRPHPRGGPSRPGARRADERGVDRPLGRSPARPWGRRPARRAGGGDPHGRRARGGSDRGRRPRRGRLLRRRAARRGHAPARLARPARGRATARRARPRSSRAG